jgi:hypothetical protein
MLRSAGLGFAALALSLGAIAGVVLAEPLAKEECDRLQAEQTALTQAGVREQLGRGAEWGKTNLSPPQLKSIERFIQLEEQLSFRCGLAKLRASLPLAEEGGDQELDEKGNPVAAKAKQGQSAGAQSKDKSEPVPNEAAPAKKKTTDAAPAKSEAQPSGAKASKAKAKAKVDDAYRPPARKEPGADPFAGQPPDQKQ